VRDSDKRTIELFILLMIQISLNDTYDGISGAGRPAPAGREPGTGGPPKNNTNT
jgi:hypothetical protein